MSLKQQEPSLPDKEYVSWVNTLGKYVFRRPKICQIMTSYASL